MANRTRRQTQLRRSIMLFVGAVGIAGCTSEKVVFRDREVVGNVPTAAANFVGYSDNTRKQTVCGACHIGSQALWAQTGHAQAYDSLPAADRTNPACLTCHTTSGRGNVGPTTVAGFASTNGDARYRDVQCESCHGAGLSHASNPTTANRPLATARVGSASAEGCGQCHNSSFSPTYQEWQSSAHGQMAQWSATGPNTRAECQGCHTGQGALSVMGVDARSSYKEKGQVATAPLQITCTVCHDPHSKAIPGQLRLAINVPDESRNLCMTCHNRRGTPDLASPSRGVHAPEGPLLLGNAGWMPPGLTFPGGAERIIGTHGSSANPKMCAGCHVTRFSVRDSSGRVALNYTGHTFESLPCVDANGAPTRRNDCQIAGRTFKSCVASGCHGTETAARSAFSAASLRLTTLKATLDGLLARVPRTEFSTTDNRYTTAEGSTFNSSIAGRVGSVAHNPYLTEALLIGSINAVRREYNLTITESIDLSNTLMVPMAERKAAPKAAAAGGQ
jgi:predicted CXXCH cytochrome family protein